MNVWGHEAGRRRPDSAGPRMFAATVAVQEPGKMAAKYQLTCRKSGCLERDASTRFGFPSGQQGQAVG